VIWPGYFSTIRVAKLVKLFNSKGLAALAERLIKLRTTEAFVCHVTVIF
jgi:hypothetical protein